MVLARNLYNSIQLNKSYFELALLELSIGQIHKIICWIFDQIILNSVKRSGHKVPNHNKEILNDLGLFEESRSVQSEHFSGDVLNSIFDMLVRIGILVSIASVFLSLGFSIFLCGCQTTKLS